MLLFTLTTDGTSREDGNVYYARQIIVDTPESNRTAVTAVVEQALRVGPNKPDPRLVGLEDFPGNTEALIAMFRAPSGDVRLDPFEDDYEETCKKFGDSAVVIDALTAAGYTATEVVPVYVTLHND